MNFFFSFFILFVLPACSGNSTETTPAVSTQSCEGCEAIHESPIPHNRLNSVDTLADYLQEGPKLHVSGTIYKADGKTPASDVVLYIYHTDQTGVYPTRGEEKGWGQRHGYLRGWIKTGADGRYAFYTLRPASYPRSTAPAHIHMIVKEPGSKEYWIDDIVFDNDPFVDASYRKSVRSQGGNGIIKTSKSGGVEYAVRDIILGLNIR